MKKFTARDIIDSIEKNGLPQTVGALFRQAEYLSPIYNFEEDTVIGSACALGQAAINLGVDYSFVDIFYNRAQEGFLGYIVNLNDNQLLDFKGIADILRVEFGDKLDTIVFSAEEFDYSPFLPKGYGTQYEW